MFQCRRRITGALAGVAAASMILTGCGQSDKSESAKADQVAEELPESIQKSGTIRFGSAMNQTPWSFFDDQHEPTGIEVDLCTEIANRLGVDAKWSDLDWQALIPGLQAGRFDASCAGIYITPEREEIVSLVPHLNSGLSIMVKDDSDEQLDDLNGLCGKSVSVLQGSSQETKLKDQNKTCEGDGHDELSISSFDSQPMAVQELQNGRVDAFVASDQLSGYYAKTYDGLAVAVDGIDPVKVGIAVPKESTELAEVFESELKAMSKDGSYQEILKEWGVENSELDELAGSEKSG